MGPLGASIRSKRTHIMQRSIVIAGILFAAAVFALPTPDDVVPEVLVSGDDCSALQSATACVASKCSWVAGVCTVHTGATSSPSAPEPTSPPSAPATANADTTAPEPCDDSCQCDQKATAPERLACHADIDKAECDKCHSECDQKQGADAETCIRACDDGAHCSNGMDKAAATKCEKQCKGTESMMACLNVDGLSVKADTDTVPCTSCATCLAARKGKTLNEMLHEMSQPKASDDCSALQTEIACVAPACSWVAGVCTVHTGVVVASGVTAPIITKV